mgnify:CR=1 FL=1
MLLSLALFAFLDVTTYHCDDEFYLLFDSGHSTISFSSFRLNEPERIVIEITGISGAKMPSPSPGATVRRIEKDVSGERVRLVFYIEPGSAYTILHRKNMLLVGFRQELFVEDDTIETMVTKIEQRIKEIEKQRLLASTPEVGTEKQTIPLPGGQSIDNKGMVSPNKGTAVSRATVVKGTPVGGEETLVAMLAKDREKEKIRAEEERKRREEEERRLAEMKRAEEERKRREEEERRLGELKRAEEEKKRLQEEQSSGGVASEEERIRSLKVVKVEPVRQISEDAPLLKVVTLAAKGRLKNLYFRKFPEFSRVTMEVTGDLDYVFREIKGGYVIDVHNFEKIPRHLLHIIDTRAFNAEVRYIYPKKVGDIFKIYIKADQNIAVRKSEEEEGTLIHFDFYVPMME